MYVVLLIMLSYVCVLFQQRIDAAVIDVMHAVDDAKKNISCDSIIRLNSNKASPYTHTASTIIRVDLASGANYVMSRCIFVGEEFTTLCRVQRYVSVYFRW